MIYRNIKHAFLQLAETKSTIVLLHFELKHDIICGTTKAKKTNYIQFFVDLGGVDEATETRSRTYDEDGLMEEQEQRRRMSRMNERFRDFSKKMDQAWGRISPKLFIEGDGFDIPYRDLAFEGVPYRTNVTIMPTVHALVALDDSPPMCMSLSDVDVAVFERIRFSLKSFDLVFVFKDMKKFVTITSIPSKSLDAVKQWLNSCDIVFFEKAINHVWKKILPQIGVSCLTPGVLLPYVLMFLFLITSLGDSGGQKGFL